MKFTILLSVFCLLFAISSSAQNPYSVKGAAVDTTANAKLFNASVSVLNSKDSTLVKFTRVSKAGTFAVPNLHKGSFILLVTYPEYADYVERFSLDSAHTSHDFKAIKMLLKSKLLADVVIKGTRAAIKIKGDTTEFDPRAFKIQPNATVEDLLKQLPGIQVDKDGKITAQGQTVPKVLVDGEEFFGDDPTLVTKNLRADMVDKVQLYDKKSDQATFTGIDDGQKTKTINVQLKADKKNGYFGKAEAGGGSDGYYQGSLLYNRFKGKSKFSAYAITGNNGKTGLSWEDADKYGQGFASVEFGDEGSVSFSFNGGGDDGLDSFGGQYYGQGIPVARTGGVHFDTKWNKDKESLNANYKIGSLTVDGTENTLSQNNTPQGAINSNTTRDFHNYMFRQKLDGTYTVKLDTTSNLKIMVDGSIKNSNTRNNSTSESDQDGVAVNNGTNNTINDASTKVFDFNALYTKKFKKKGRTFSLSAIENVNNADAHGFLRSTNQFFDADGKVANTETIDQLKTGNTTSSKLTTNAAYTEPLTKVLSVIVNYAFGYNHGVSNQRSFNQSAPGVYNLQVDSLSSDYRLNEISNQVGAIFNMKGKKATFNFGTKVSNVNFDQMNEMTGVPFKRDFVNWAPQAYFQYRFSQRQFLSINYNGRTTQPSISQIQPVANNSNPLNVIVGNPDLRPSFANNFNFYYNSYKVVSGQALGVNGGYSFTNNPIISNLTTLLTDSVKGKTISQYINLRNKTPFNYNFRTYFDKKIEAIDMNVGFNLSLNGSTSYSISNEELNKTIYDNYSGQINFSKYKEKKYQFYVSAGPNYTISHSSLTPNISNNGRGFRSDGGFNVYLPAKFQIGSDVSYEFTAKTQTFDQDLKKTLWNANLTKTFFKNDDLKLTLWVNDILNQNVGFSRNVSGNFIQQDSYTTIKRYVMFTVTWNFNSMASLGKK